MPKKKYEEIKGMTLEEYHQAYPKDVDKDEWDDEITYYVSRYSALENSYELGKYTGFNGEKMGGKRFFDLDETNDSVHNSDSEWLLVEKDFLKLVIEDYRSKIKKYYEEMVSVGRFGFPDKNKKIEDLTKEEIAALYNHVADMGSDWINPWDTPPYNLDSDDDKITNSWKYEYTIFELVRLYKSVDWENNILVFTGG